MGRSQSPRSTEGIDENDESMASVTGNGCHRIGDTGAVKARPKHSVKEILRGPESKTGLREGRVGRVMWNERNKARQVA